MRILPAIFIVSWMALLSGCASMPDAVITDPASEAMEMSVNFTPQTETFTDRLVFRFIPDTERPEDYLVTYSIFKNHKRMLLAEEDLMKDISRRSPIIISINRDKGYDYTLKMSIFAKDNSELPLFKNQFSIKAEE